ncbi:ASCH domain-containing protein [Bacillus sp. BGMRC 2118]|nr:ASCH domain-containing protein [Bacillus sp. BGMRC 2118]
MKVLSMKQPWAHLFVLGENKYETRSWQTKYRGPLAIHTSKAMNKSAANEKGIQTLLNNHGITPDALPTGVIIATCVLMDCVQITENNQDHAILATGEMVEGNDYYLGDFTVGGFVWVVESMQLLDEFIPAKGQLGLWEHEI